MLALICDAFHRSVAESELKLRDFAIADCTAELLPLPQVEREAIPMTQTYLASNHPSGITWDAANAEAQSLGGYLVTINDAAEDSLVGNWIWHDASRFGTNDPVTGEQFHFLPWIGAYLPSGSDSYAWADGEPFTYSNWDGTPTGNAAELVLDNSMTGEI